MNKCIYCLRDDTKTKFTSGDHIIPRNIGGLNHLDFGMVCDECNGYFSILEKRFIYDSIIALPKQFDGPSGRSGKYKTNLHILVDNNSGEAKLGYIEQGGLPYYATQCLVVNNEKVQFIFNAADSENIDLLVSDFSEKCRLISNKQIIFIKSEKLHKGCPILSIYKDKLIAGIQHDDDKSVIFKLKEKLASEPPNVSQVKDVQTSKSFVESSQNLKFSIDDFFRVIGKITLNSIAAHYSSEIALKPELDELRNYIRYGTKVSGFEFVTFLDKNAGVSWFNGLTKSLHLPPKAHVSVCGELYTPKNIIGVLSLYDHAFEFVVRLNNSNGTIFNNGIPHRVHILEYENKNEYELFEKMVSESQKLEKMRLKEDF